MRRALMMTLLLLTASVIPAQAEVRWIGETEGKEIFGGWIKDLTGPPGRGYWAGKVVEVEVDINEAKTGLTLTGRVKVEITWVTDRTSYRCHETYIIHSDEAEDFSHRSLMLRECD